MGVWRLLAKLVRIKQKNDENWLIPDPNAGRILYEEYDPNIGGPSEKSRFFQVRYAKLHPKKSVDGEEVLGRVEMNMDDAEMIRELSD